MLTKIISGGKLEPTVQLLMWPLNLISPMADGHRRAEKLKMGVLPDKYQLQEMPTTSYPKHTETSGFDAA